jgi:prepilin peptidase CpaA
VLVLRKLPLPAFAVRWDWLARLHEPKTGVPYGIALAAAALFVYPQTAIWSAVVGS